jgi:hypothetical protein
MAQFFAAIWFKPMWQISPVALVDSRDVTPSVRPDDSGVAENDGCSEHCKSRTSAQLAGDGVEQEHDREREDAGVLATDQQADEQHQEQPNGAAAQQTHAKVLQHPDYGSGGIEVTSALHCFCHRVLHRPSVEVAAVLPRMKKPLLRPREQSAPIHAARAAP